MKEGNQIQMTFFLAVVLFKFLGYTIQAAFTPIDNYLIACGSSQNVTFQGRTFVPDSGHSSLSLKSGSSFVVSSNYSSVPSPIYQSARVFSSSASYKFYVKQKGRHWVRLYFYPLPTSSQNLTSASITVVTDDFVLLNNFKFVKYNASFLFKEYAIKVTSHTLNLTFIPSKNSVSFVNAIEVVSIPDAVLPDKALGIYPEEGIEIFLSEFAMGTVYRLNMGGPLITAENDTLGRTWENDDKYLGYEQYYSYSSIYKVSVDPASINYYESITPEIAPRWVFATAISVSDRASWVFPVDPNFGYIARAHFYKVLGRDSLLRLSINNQQVDTIHVSETKPFYKDYVSYPSIQSDTLSVDIEPFYHVATINGLEIIKISNDVGSLDGLSPVRNLLTEKGKDKSKDKKVVVNVVTKVIAGVTIFITTSTFLLLIWMQVKYRGIKHESRQNKAILNKGKTEARFSTNDAAEESLNEVKLQKLPLFNFQELATATNNFHPLKKLGQGGYGPVYKGILEDGKEIAVKRSSKVSSQGLQEFMNEVVVISKLQHRNLVGLLGCCVEREEKMLVYEYMPNKSLDVFLFDPLKQELLDWKKRFNIIQGISRGLLYLHRDSRLMIIHRDLKASNVLLDKELNPKISDFGMARIFEEDEIQANTKRVVGTYGYISPEYAMQGQFSEKSDIFSFGVLLLEIVSGRKNTSFYNNQHCNSLLAYAWKLWQEENILELVDKRVSNSNNHSEALRCIHIGLLCVQKFPQHRPTMASVVSMLNGETMHLPTPKQLAFIEKDSTQDAGSFQEDKITVNDVTFTEFDGR